MNLQLPLLTESGSLFVVHDRLPDSSTVSNQRLLGKMYCGILSTLLHLESVLLQASNHSISTGKVLQTNDSVCGLVLNTLTPSHTLTHHTPSHITHPHTSHTLTPSHHPHTSHRDRRWRFRSCQLEGECVFVC